MTNNVPTQDCPNMTAEYLAKAAIAEALKGEH